jgi:predicted small metal-binding protein
MRRLVRCTCGVEIRAEETATLIQRVRKHAKDAHDLELSDEQILAMMEIEQ